MFYSKNTRKCPLNAENIHKITVKIWKIQRKFLNIKRNNYQ